VDGDCYAFILRFKSLGHLLQAFCVFSHVTYKRYWLDL
jgi:hypothetical protein